MSDSKKTCVIWGDFGASLNFSVIELDNLSVNNHAVIQNVFVCDHWKKVEYFLKKEKNDVVVDQTIINDYDKWIFFGDTLSSEEKTKIIFSIIHPWIIFGLL